MSGKLRNWGCVTPVKFASLMVASSILLWDRDLASGQSFQDPQEFELTQTRRELERIIAEDPAEAPNARNALDALEQPASSPVGRQARNRRERGERRIVNGIPTGSYSAVGALLKGADRRTARAWCSGTLVGCDKYLTAAHCIADNPLPRAYVVFFQNFGFFEVKEIQWQKDDYKFPYFDLAMLKLARPLEGASPMPINYRDLAPPSGFPGTIVGFGRTGGSRYDSGIKREGTIKIKACPPRYENSKLLCWSYNSDIKSSDSASNTCFADSGGGVFMLDSDDRGHLVPKVFGVVSGGRDRNCTENDLSYNVDVGRFRQWIETVGEGRLVSGICGNPIMPSKEFASRQTIVHLDGTNHEVIIKLEVPNNIVMLRVAMNGEDNSLGKNDFDLSVFRGERVQSAAPACDESGTGQFAFCEIERPDQGTWSIVVSRKKGEGDAQITATLVQAHVH